MPTSVMVVMSLMVCTVVGVLIALGRVVYKDAKAMGMNAGLWTAVVILVPNLMGLVIYLVVRNNAKKQYHCSNCGESVKEDYNLCPNCKSLFEKICHVCKNAVKSNMTYCPYCGNKVEEMEEVETATKVTTKTNIIKPLAIIGGTYIGIMILVVGAMVTIGIADMNNVAIMQLEMNTFDKMQATFQYKIGSESRSFKLEADEELTLDVDVALEKGSIQLVVEDPEDQVIYEKLYEVGDYKEEILIKADTAGKYKVRIKVNAASGHYKIEK